MGSMLSGCGAAAPRGAESDVLVYCSYSATHHGGLGKDYCELIADPGQKPKVVVRLHQGNHLDPGEVNGDFTVRKAVVADLQKQLEDANVRALNGYQVDEQMMGGTTYRIYMEYASGEKVNAVWFGHDIKREALAAYSLIERFFQPWIQQCSSH